MKWFFRIFFRTIRLVLTPLMLLWERLTPPRALVRTPERQQQVDAETARLALYQFRACPFCLRVRREMARLALAIELRDAQHDAAHRQALQQGGGEIKVPCLRIEGADGSTTWMYESAEIIRYLQERYAG